MEKKTFYERACEYAKKVNESYGSGFFNTHTLVDAYMAGVNEALGTQERQRRHEIAKECSMMMIYAINQTIQEAYKHLADAEKRNEEVLGEIVSLQRKTAEEKIKYADGLKVNN